MDYKRKYLKYKQKISNLGGTSDRVTDQQARDDTDRELIRMKDQWELKDREACATASESDGQEICKLIDPINTSDKKCNTIGYQNRMLYKRNNMNPLIKVELSCLRKFTYQGHKLYLVPTRHTVIATKKPYGVYNYSSIDSALTTPGDKRIAGRDPDRYWWFLEDQLNKISDAELIVETAYNADLEIDTNDNMINLMEKINDNIVKARCESLDQELDASCSLISSFDTKYHSNYITETSSWNQDKAAIGDKFNPDKNKRSSGIISDLPVEFYCGAIKSDFIQTYLIKYYYRNANCRLTRIQGGDGRKPVIRNKTNRVRQIRYFNKDISNLITWDDDNDISKIHDLNTVILNYLASLFTDPKVNTYPIIRLISVLVSDMDQTKVFPTGSDNEIPIIKDLILVIIYTSHISQEHIKDLEVREKTVLQSILTNYFTNQYIDLIISINKMRTSGYRIDSTTINIKLSELIICFSELLCNLYLFPKVIGKLKTTNLVVAFGLEHINLLDNIMWNLGASLN